MRQVIMGEAKTADTSTDRCPVCCSELVRKPVPGALHYPQRLECPTHGYWTPDSPSFSPEDEAAYLAGDAVKTLRDHMPNAKGPGNNPVPDDGTGAPRRSYRVYEGRIAPPDVGTVDISAIPTDVADVLKSNKQFPAIGFGKSIRIEWDNKTQMSRYSRSMEKSLDAMEAEWRENVRAGVIPPTPEEMQAIEEMFRMPELCLFLTEEERTAYMHHNFFDMSLAEIATEMGKPRPTVQKIVGRAHDKLMGYLKELSNAAAGKSKLYVKLRAAVAPEPSSIDLEIENYVSTNPDGGMSIRKVR
jgi:predicted DNA-binding protein YlxM (UPF0122 family)